MIEAALSFIPFLSFSRLLLQTHGYGLLGLKADHAVDQLTVLEDKKCGDALDAELRRGHGIFINVQLGYRVTTL